MRDHYDFSDSKPNPYASKLKKQVTIRLDEDTIDYFKQMSERQGIPYRYQTDRTCLYARILSSVVNGCEFRQPKILRGRMAKTKFDLEE
ncbi:hypothetical protein MELB17_14456 [Marinobacter sp. ELB17]|nr:hypothetical protein MELB17_14456 [Marinobacter sp. ELB17]